MRYLLSCLLLLGSTVLWSAPASAATVILKGEVLEVQDVDNYTYLHLKTSSGELWSAVATSAVKKGDTVTVENAEQMDNFESKALKKTFPKIFFGSLAATPESNAAKVSAAHAGAANADFSGDVKVSKAVGPQGRSVAEIINQRVELKDKTVLLHARVVKFSAAIMGKNWLHLRDGSGSAADATQDLVATSAETFKIGDIVQITGTVRTDKDFGAGYAYKVLIEDGELKK